MNDTDYITKKYFDEKIKSLLVEIKTHNDALLEGFRHYIVAMTEQKTTRTQVREINSEENKSTHLKLTNHETRIVSLEEIVL